MAITQITGVTLKLDGAPVRAPAGLSCLIEGDPELVGDHGVILGVEDQDGAVNEGDPLVSHKADVIVSQALGEEPVEPGHLAPHPAHRMVPHLVEDVVEWGLEHQPGGADPLLRQE